MSRVQMLRALVNQRLTAAVEEIFVLFERTISEYEEEIDQQRRMLEDAVKPEIQINKAALPPDVRQLNISKEEDRSPSLDQDPELPHIKEEQLWTSQEGEQLQGLEVADITKFPFTPVPVKSEYDEEEPQSSQLHQSQSEENREAEPLASTSTDQMKPEADGDRGGSEPDSDLDTASDLQQTSADQLLSPHCSEPEPEDRDDDSNETREPQSGLKSQRVEGQGSSISINFRRPMELKSPNQIPSNVGCKVCGKIFSFTRDLEKHMTVHTRQNPFSCIVCGKGFAKKDALNAHMRSHTGEKPFDCQMCGKGFGHKGHLLQHMRIHTGEKPFDCEICGKGFGRKENLQTHMRIHTGEKPFDCKICGKGFGRKGHLQQHIRSHTGEKPFDCEICGKGFGRKVNLQVHMRIHTGEKPLSCSDCGTRFRFSTDVTRHMRIHTGEKP